jgi:hypothetical protein
MTPVAEVNAEFVNLLQTQEVGSRASLVADNCFYCNVKFSLLQPRYLITLITIITLITLMILIT